MIPGHEEWDVDIPGQSTGARGEISTNSKGAPLTRRGVLATVGAVAISSAVATRKAGATDAVRNESVDVPGYGAGAYGDGPYGDPLDGGAGETLLAVETHDATDVGGSSATLVGELAALDGYDEATVYFEWGEPGDRSNATDARTLASPVEFDDEVTGLERGTKYEFHAVAESGDDAATGGTQSFTTGGGDPDAVPRIVRLDAADTSNPRNPHVDASVEWEASLEEGELRSAELTIADSTGLVHSWEYDLSGRSTARTETEKIHRGGGETYTVELTVHSSHGTTDSERTNLDTQ